MGGCSPASRSRPTSGHASPHTSTASATHTSRKRRTQRIASFWARTGRKSRRPRGRAVFVIRSVLSIVAQDQPRAVGPLEGPLIDTLEAQPDVTGGDDLVPRHFVRKGGRAR